jgi:hypothetical protein
MITFNHLEGVWDGLSAEDRAAHQEWLERFVAELRAETGSELVFVPPPRQRKTVRKRAASSALEVESGLAGSNEVRQVFLLPACWRPVAAFEEGSLLDVSELRPWATLLFTLVGGGLCIVALAMLSDSLFSGRGWRLYFVQTGSRAPYLARKGALCGAIAS